MITDIRSVAQRTLATEVIDGDFGIRIALVNASGVGGVERALKSHELGIGFDRALQAGLVEQSKTTLASWQLPVS